MPTQDNGREKIKQFLKDNNITITSLAVLFDLTRAELNSFLTGKVQTTKANMTLLKIIEDLGIR